jgi:LPPG:FO 2-phospho-L-lactate transferase
VKVTALAGGVGGAKLMIGLDRAVPPEDLTAIINTGDDAVIYGVHVSPDVDIVTYWLAGLADVQRGWGIKDDTFSIVAALKALGQEAWFQLGDRDFATCLVRTARLRAGASLTTITDEIRRHLNVRPRILPMSDDPVRTSFVTTDDRRLEFQEYFVKEQHRPDIAEVILNGIDDAKPAPGVLDAINEADLIVVCPSNPIISI